MKETKPDQEFETTLGPLELRLGRITQVSRVECRGKPHYSMQIDFGKFGTRRSIGRFTQHAIEELEGLLVVGVLNLGTKDIDGHVSEVLTLGVQFPKADSGEATFLVPLNAAAKVGGKVF